MSAEEVQQRPGVRVVPFIRYPYRVFYRVTDEALQRYFTSTMPLDEVPERSGVSAVIMG